MRPVSIFATADVRFSRDAIHFSGAMLLTIGYGDITPHAILLHLAALVEGTASIAVLSLATAYLLTVYGAVERKWTAALAFYHQAGRGADVASFITHHFRRAQFIGFDDIIRTRAREMQMLMESHIEHPMTHYFHSEMRAKSLPRMIFLLIETATIVETYLSPVVHVEICDHPDMVTLKQNALAVEDELILVLRLQKRASDPIDASIEELARHRHCCQRTMCQLATSDTTTRDDQLAFQDYIQARGRWERKLGGVSRFLGYDWEEILGDQDLDHATIVRRMPASRGVPTRVARRYGLPQLGCEAFQMLINQGASNQCCCPTLGTKVFVGLLRSFSGVLAMGLAFTARRSLFTLRTSTGAWLGALGSTSEVAIGT